MFELRARARSHTPYTHGRVDNMHQSPLLLFGVDTGHRKMRNYLAKKRKPFSASRTRKSALMSDSAEGRQRGEGNGQAREHETITFARAPDLSGQLALIAPHRTSCC